MPDPFFVAKGFGRAHSGISREENFVAHALLTTLKI
jgi:hypothetical protein